MEKFNALIVMLLLSLTCFGQKTIIYTDSEPEFIIRNQAIALEALSKLADTGMKECISYPGDYGVTILMDWQVDSGFHTKSMTFKCFNNVDERYKQQDWYHELDLDCKEKIFRTDEIDRIPILNAWCNEIIKIADADTIYPFIVNDYLPRGKSIADKRKHYMLYGTRNHWKTEYRRTDTTDLEQWIKRMKQLKLRDAFLEYEKRHPKSIGPVNKVPSPPGCIIN